MKVDNLSMMLIALICVLLGIYIYKSMNNIEGYEPTPTLEFYPQSHGNFVSTTCNGVPDHRWCDDIITISDCKDPKYVLLKKYCPGMCGMCPKPKRAPQLQIERAPRPQIERAPPLQIERAPIKYPSKVNTLCQDKDWRTYRDSRKNCSWVGKNPRKRCDKVGRVNSITRVRAKIACPSVCNKHCSHLKK